MRQWLFRVAAMTWKYKKEHPAHVISLYLIPLQFHSIPGTHHRPNRPYRPLARAGKIAGAFQRGHGCSGWMRWHGSTRKASCPLHFNTRVCRVFARNSILPTASQHEGVSRLSFMFVDRHSESQIVLFVSTLVLFQQGKWARKEIHPALDHSSSLLSTTSRRS